MFYIFYKFFIYINDKIYELLWYIKMLMVLIYKIFCIFLYVCDFKLFLFVYFIDVLLLFVI